MVEVKFRLVVNEHEDVEGYSVDGDLTQIEVGPTKYRLVEEYAKSTRKTVQDIIATTILEMFEKWMKFP